MKISIKTKNVKLTKALQNFIEEKINSLEKFSKILYSEDYNPLTTLPSFGRAPYYNHFFGRGKPRVEAWVEVGKETKHHQKGLFFRAECQLRFPGKSIRSEAVSKNLKLAINEVRDELQRELKEYKEKEGRAVKKELKISP